MGVKIGLQDLSPMFLTSFRFLGGGIILFIFTLFFSGIPHWSKAKGSLTMGILLTGFGTTAVSYGIKYIPSGLVAVLVALLPVWTFLLDFLFFSKKSPSKLSALGLVLGFVGVFLLFNPFVHIAGTDEIPILPVIVIFLGSIAWGLGSLISIKITQVSGMQGVSLQMMAGGFFALLCSYVFESNQLFSILNMNFETLSAMAYLILIGSYIGYSAYIWLINNAPPILTSSYAYANPVVAMLLGYYLSNEKLSTMAITAGILILTGVVFMTLGRRKKVTY